MTTAKENLQNQPDKHPKEEGWREIKTSHSASPEGSSETEETRGDAWEDRDLTFNHTAGMPEASEEELGPIGRMGNPTAHDESDFFEEENKGHTLDIRNEAIDEKHRKRIQEIKHRHSSHNSDPGFGATDRG